MRVLQLGVGAVGEVTARVIAQEPAVEAVVLADIDEGRLREVAGKLPPGKAETRVVDASDHAALVAATSDVDLVLNALATAWDIPVMEACLDAGRHYLDMGTGGRVRSPARPTSTSSSRCTTSSRSGTVRRSSRSASTRA